MITPEQIREDLANSPNKTILYDNGFNGHPGDGQGKYRSLSLFAETSKALDSLVEDYKAYGWSVWIKGTMAGIPAAYLYREVK